MKLTVDVRRSGIVVPLGALRSADSSGVGEYPDLALLGEICQKAGLSFIQLLPVNDTGSQSSPYSSLSAFALHPLYLRLDDLPEARDFRGEREAMAEHFENARRFSYREVLAAKMELLRRIYKASTEEIRGNPGLKEWIAANPWVREYTSFLKLKRTNGERPWNEWGEFVHPAAKDLDWLWSSASKEADHLFYAWVQMRCEEQLSNAAKTLASLGVALKGDLPILMSADSVDVWAHRSWFKVDRMAGAPPDMFSDLGQNWGFPLYDWEALAREEYSFWMDRLKQAAKFYGAYRIDHVLGFFRIWALPEREESGYLGSFEPNIPITRDDLGSAGFSPERIRWLAEPHIREDALRSAASGSDPSEALAAVLDAALERIGQEPLFLFRSSIRGGKDIQALNIPESMKAFLLTAWRDRALIAVAPDCFTPAWRYYSASSWPTLSDAERGALEDLIRSKEAASEAAWEEHGRILLSALKNATGMLPCAEDLGAVPPCVPKVLAELGILGLRIPRWTRRWGEPGDPFIAPADYPELSVCAPSVHDTSTLRDWWINEASPADREAAHGGPVPPGDWSPALGGRLLKRWAEGRSALLVVQLQDLLDLSDAYASDDPADERVNVPGTINDRNWTWRMPVSLEFLIGDVAWIAAVRNALSR